MALALICHPQIQVHSRRRDGDDVVEIWYRRGRYLGYGKAKQYGRILPAETEINGLDGMEMKINEVKVLKSSGRTRRRTDTVMALHVWACSLRDLGPLAPPPLLPLPLPLPLLPPLHPSHIPLCLGRPSCL